MRKTSTLYFRFFSTCLAIISLSACATSKRLVDSLPPTFLEDVDISSKKERLPFDHSWSDPSVNWDAYKGIYLKPIRTDLLEEGSWKASISLVITSEEDYQAEAKTLADYFKEQLVSEVNKHQGKYLATVAAAPAPGIATLEIVFTELEFSHPLKTAAGMAAPLPGAGVAATAISDPYATIALRLTDSTTGRLLATAADRKFTPTRLINLSKLRVTSPNREICRLWAEEIAEVLSSDALTTIGEVKWRWLPW